MMLAILLVLAVVGWGLMFLPSQDGVWLRTWLVAAVLSTVAVGALVLDGRIRTVIGPVGPIEVGLGLAVGGAWLVATHIGHSVLCRLFPSFIERVNDLYSLKDRTDVLPVLAPLVAMGLTEELVFRGYVQAEVGVVGAVLAYAGVQLVVRNWALFLAALLGGVVWGTLAWWRDGLIAAMVAHVLWTGALTFLWPLRGCADQPDPAATPSFDQLAQEGTPR